MTTDQPKRRGRPPGSGLPPEPRKSETAAHAVVPLPAPTPDAVHVSRVAAGISQAQAAALVHLGSAMRWSDYERGVRSIDLARWELWLLRVGQHPTARLID